MVFHADPYLMEELIFTLIPVLTSGIPSVLLGIASYVLTSMALYSLASRRGIGKAWLSWVPILNVWIVGSLSDQYRYVVKGQCKSKRKILLILKLVSVIFVLAAVIAGGGGESFFNKEVSAVSVRYFHNVALFARAFDVCC